MPLQDRKMCLHDQPAGFCFDFELSLLLLIGVNCQIEGSPLNRASKIIGCYLMKKLFRCTAVEMGSFSWLMFFNCTTGSNQCK